MEGAEILSCEEALTRAGGWARGEAERLAKKGLDPDGALSIGCLLVAKGEADGFVGGAANTTADTVRAAIMIVGTESSVGVLSSFFLISTPHSRSGEGGHFLFADCAIVSQSLGGKAGGDRNLNSRQRAELFWLGTQGRFFEFLYKGIGRASGCGEGATGGRDCEKQDAGYPF